MNGMWEPYCGSAPLPADVLSRWNFDPALVVAMVALAALHIHMLVRAGELRRKLRPAAIAWTLLFLLFVSPLCALTSALFSARAVHHVVLIAAVAPAIILSLPSRWTNLSVTAALLWTILGVHTAAVWLWHAPAAYELALSSNAVFWIMQTTLLLSAAAFWGVALSCLAPLHLSLSLLLGAVVQMGLLGALITFSRTALYAPHYLVTQPFGLTPLEDQQIAGLIMWVPALVPYLIAALVLIGTRLKSSPPSGRWT